MSQETQKYFELALKKLEKAYKELKQNHIDFKETEKIKFLQELVKEQIRDEDTHPATR